MSILFVKGQKYIAPRDKAIAHAKSTWCPDVNRNEDVQEYIDNYCDMLFIAKADGIMEYVTGRNGKSVAIARSECEEVIDNV